MEPFIGQIMQVGFNFAPRGWLRAWGQTIGIAQNTAMFSLLGTTFGGNGQQTFGLPDSRSRVFIGQGQGPGLSPYQLGQMSGTESVTLNITQLPAHNHPATFTPSGGGGATGTLQALSGVNSGVTSIPAAGSFLANTSDPDAGGTPLIYAPAGSSGTPVNLGGLTVSGGGGGGTVQVGMTGNNSAVPILQPYLAITTIIATEGIFPPRN